MGLKTVNVTIDNVNPMIAYAPSNWWHEGPTSDPEYSDYDHGGTFTLTQQQGANASFTFRGITIWIFGAKRSNHGTFSASIDGRTYSDTGYSATDVFEQVLFSADQLDNSTEHTVVLTDTGDVQNMNVLDVDSIIYQTEMDEDLVAVTQQDTDSAFNYQGSWSTNPDQLTSYSEGTGHSTSISGASVTYNFEGFSVQIFGTAGPNNGGYTVQIDNGSLSTYNATKSNFFPQTMLYETNGLSEGEHAVTLVNQPFSSGQQLNIDYAVVNQLPTSGGGSSSLSGGAIGGIVAGVCGVIVLVLAALYFLRRRKREGGVYDRGTPGSVHAYAPDQQIVPSGQSTYQTSTFQWISQPPVSVHQGAAYSNPSGLPSVGRVKPYHPSPVSRNLSSPVQSASEPINAMHNPSESTSSGISHVATVAGPSEAGTGSQSSQPVTPSSRKRRRNPLPPAPQVPVVIQGSELDQRTTRMQVEGRQQDWGPVTFEDLPPDYNQATEPFHGPPAGTGR